MKIYSAALKLIAEWFYPPVCMGCSTGYYPDSFLCENCLRDELESLPPRMEASISQTVLPDGILFQDAVWAFHKNQLVQELLHAVKYGGMANLAVELGRKLGDRLKTDTSLPSDVILVPVPLHPNRRRKRGYNQAEEIAKGISERTGWEILPEGNLKRVKNTKTQTGFSMEKRQMNISQAFEFTPTGKTYQLAIIVDDVFTTGATVFELHKSIYPNLARKSAIATLAIA